MLKNTNIVLFSSLCLLLLTSYRPGLAQEATDPSQTSAKAASPAVANTQGALVTEATSTEVSVDDSASKGEGSSKVGAMTRASKKGLGATTFISSKKSNFSLLLAGQVGAGARSDQTGWGVTSGLRWSYIFNSSVGVFVGADYMMRTALDVDNHWLDLPLGVSFELFSKQSTRMLVHAGAYYSLLLDNLGDSAVSFGRDSMLGVLFQIDTYFYSWGQTSLGATLGLKAGFDGNYRDGALLERSQAFDHPFELIMGATLLF